MDYCLLSDRELLPLFRDNDMKAVDVLTQRYMEKAKLIALSLNAKGFEVADLMQEGMLGFLSATCSFREGQNASFSTFAGICMKNSMISFIRKSSSKKHIPPELIVSIEDSDDPTLSMSPEEIFISGQNAQYISDIIAMQLTEKEQRVFRLYLSGLSYEEIAASVGSTPKAVDSTLQRARKKLRLQLR